MTALLPGSALPPASDLVDAIYLRTDGIPLHVEELLALLRDATDDGRRRP